MRKPATRPAATGALLLALAGCIQNSVGPIRTDPGPPDDSSAMDSDGGECGASQPAVVPAPRSCVLPPVQWDLGVKWRWDDGEHLQQVPHVGRFEDTDGDGLITARDPVEILLTRAAWGQTNPQYLLSGSGELLSEFQTLTGWGMYATLGETAPENPGMEWVMAGLSPDASSFAVATAGATGLLYKTEIAAVAEVSSGPVFLTDLDADGAPEVVGSGFASRAIDGSMLFDFAAPHAGSTRTVAADLDLDGLPEIVAEEAFQPVVLSHDGLRLAVCPILDAGTTTEGNMMFAIGDLDADAEGEFVAARPGLLAVCDIDGALVASLAVESVNATTLGIGELDGDATPEIVVDEYRTGAAVPESIAAYTSDLRLLWRHDLAVDDGKAPFALADLDGDGRHEVLVHPSSGGVVILGPDGSVLAEIDGPATGGSDGPIVADLDGDGLAEILVAGESPSVEVYTNEAGGWLVAGADAPWPGVDHFPGDRDVDGSLPSGGEAPWGTRGRNVWQGMAAGPMGLPDLDIQLVQACSDDCETTTVAGTIANIGTGDYPVPITVDLYDAGSGEVLGTQTFDSLAAGSARAFQFHVRTDPTVPSVRVEASGAWAECDGPPNVAELTELPCE